MTKSPSAQPRRQLKIDEQREDLRLRISQLKREAIILERLTVQASNSYETDLGSEMIARVNETFRLATTIKHPIGALSVPDLIKVAGTILVFGSADASATARVWLKQLSEITLPDPEQNVFRRHSETNQQVTETSALAEAPRRARDQLDAAINRRSRIAAQSGVGTAQEIRERQRAAMLAMTPRSPSKGQRSEVAPQQPTKSPALRAQMPTESAVVHAKTPTQPTDDMPAAASTEQHHVDLGLPLRPQRARPSKPSHSAKAAIANIKGDLHSELLTFFVGHNGRGPTMHRSNHQIRLDVILRETTDPGYLNTMVEVPVDPEEVERIIDVTQRCLQQIEALTRRERENTVEADTELGL